MKLNLRNLQQMDGLYPLVPVEEFGEQIAEVAQAMLDLMVDEDGVGLAAPQAGLNLRMFVMRPIKTLDGLTHCVIINPEYVPQDAQEEEIGETEDYEACLSCKGVAVKIPRQEMVRLQYQDVGGESRQLVARGHAARVIQHEMDHLDGKCILDYNSYTSLWQSRM